MHNEPKTSDVADRSGLKREFDVYIMYEVYLVLATTVNNLLSNIVGCDGHLLLANLIQFSVRSKHYSCTIHMERNEVWLDCGLDGPCEKVMMPIFQSNPRAKKKKNECESMPVVADEFTEIYVKKTNKQTKRPTSKNSITSGAAEEQIFK